MTDAYHTELRLEFDLSVEHKTTESVVRLLKLTKVAKKEKAATFAAASCHRVNYTQLKSSS